MTMGVFSNRDDQGPEPPTRDKVGPMRRTTKALVAGQGTPDQGQAMDALVLDQHAKCLDDHEARLRDLEAFKWKVSGPWPRPVAWGLGWLSS